MAACPSTRHEQCDFTGNTAAAAWLMPSGLSEMLPIRTLYCNNLSRGIVGSEGRPTQSRSRRGNTSPPERGRVLVHWVPDGRPLRAGVQA